MDDLNDFVFHFNETEISPWNGINNPIAIFKKFGLRKFGKHQINVINYLNDKFFSTNRVFYAKQSFLAKELFTERTLINKALNALCRKGIIFKVDNDTYDSKNNRVVFLPSSKFLSKIVIKKDKSAISVEERYCAVLARKYVELQNCAVLARKLLKYRCFSNPLGNIKDNNIYNIEVSTSYLRGFQPLEEERVTSVRHKLSVKMPNDLQKVFNETSKDKFRVLKPSQINTLSKHISHRYGFDIKSLLKHADKPNTPYGERENKVRQQLLELLRDNVDIGYIDVDKAIRYFNSINHPRFQSTKIDKESKTYMQAVIAINHTIHYVCGGDYYLFKEGINNLKNYGLRSNIFVFTNKWTIIDFAADYKNKGYLQTFCNNDGEVSFRVNRRKSNYPEAMEKWKDIFIERYTDETKGKNDFRKFESRLTIFLDKIIDTMVFEQRYLCGFKLTVPANNGAPILAEYLAYLLDSFGSGFLVNDIVEHTNWLNFVNQKMRNEYGYKNFWVKLDKLEIKQ
jgi:hypothetical protein